MPKTVKAVRVDVDGTYKMVELSDLESWQKHVGGYVQAVPISGKVDVLVDEDGKSKGLDKNVQGDRVFHCLGGKLFEGDYLAGPCVFVGPTDEDGELTDLPEEVVDEITMYLKDWVR